MLSQVHPALLISSNIVTDIPLQFHHVVKCGYPETRLKVSTAITGKKIKFVAVDLKGRREKNVGRASLDNGIPRDERMPYGPSIPIELERVAGLIGSSRELCLSSRQELRWYWSSSRTLNCLRSRWNPLNTNEWTYRKINLKLDLDTALQIQHKCVHPYL